MKKTLIIIAIFIVGIAISLGIYFHQAQTFQMDQIPALTPEQLAQKIQQGDNFYVYFYSPICEQCIKTEPALRQAIKDLGLKSLVKVDVQKYADLRQTYQIQGTPTIYVYRQGKLSKGITGGFTSAADYINFFKETGGA